MSVDEQRIREVEAIARRLEPNAEARQAFLQAVDCSADDFLERIDSVPAFRASHEESVGIERSPIGEEPMSIQKTLELFQRFVDAPGLNPASGGHLAYIPGGGIYPSALGDYLAAVTNRFAGIYFAGPGAARMEQALVRWMSDLIGYPKTAGGDLTSGGSIGNLIGIITAREAHRIQAKDVPRAVVYLTRHAHHSVVKALGIAGMKEAVQKVIDVDEHYRMKPEALEAAIDQDGKAGLIPWMIVTSAGTTDTGAIDPLDRIGAIAHDKGLWHHIDAAYGGFFILCKDGQELLQGIESGHSVVMDPHKGLFLPYGSGAVIVRDKQALRSAHAYEAPYLQDAQREAEDDSPADHSLELTRHFRGLRLWLPLKLFGLAPFRACLEEKRLLAQYFYDKIQRMDGFEVGPPPELSVVTYRYVPDRGDPNDFNRRLIQEVQRDGRIFLSSTVLDGKFTLRLAVLCFRTHLDTIDLALEVLQEKARLIEESY